jgi:hypothetical protein
MKATTFGIYLSGFNAILWLIAVILNLSTKNWVGSIIAFAAFGGWFRAWALGCQLRDISTEGN